MAEIEYLTETFREDSDLCNRVLSAAKQNRDQLQLFVDIARHLTRQGQSNGISSSDTGSKKRKLDSDGNNGSSASALQLNRQDTVSVLSIPDVSFTIPVRKKLSIELLASSTGEEGKGGIAITGKDISYSLSWRSIEHVFCLPVPEKAQRQHSFVVLLQPTAGVPDDASQFVFTLSEATYSGPSAEAREGDTWVSLTGRTINTYLAALGRQVVLPTADEFESAIPQAHRKGEPGYHVKAHLGSKDGYLFLLPTGILFAFRKPILHFPFHAVSSISYTSVLQRTFNLVISTLPNTTSAADADDEPDTRDVEFAMLDQADFAGIDAYIKKHGLNDASMAKERQAKKLNVNGPRRGRGEAAATNGEAGQGDEGGEDGETELQKAEREMQDAEDEEEEEDYDPGSEGESEGEGGSSEEEGGDGGGADVDGDGVEEVDADEEEEG